MLRQTAARCAITLTVTLAALVCGPASATSAQASTPSASATQLETDTGLVMNITSVAPSTLTPGEPFTMDGTVTNTSPDDWPDAKVYLSIGADPATDRAGLAAFAAETEGFGTTINTFGLFDQIGDLAPGSTTHWHLSVPFGKLPINPIAGVFHVEATLLAGAPPRDKVADARAATTIPYLPEGTTLTPTGIVTLLPFTAPVVRLPNGAFVEDRLAGLLSKGGRLRNLLDFALQAPDTSLDIVIDPAVRQAVSDMSQGYQVQSIADAAAGIPAVRGTGRAAATAWLSDLDTLALRQPVSTLPWGTPAITSLATERLPGIVESGVLASQVYAASNGLPPTTVDWQNGGTTTRHSLSVARAAGVTTHVVSEASLPGLKRVQHGDYPPVQVVVSTHGGPVTALVSRSDIGGQPFTPDMTAIEFRQAMVAEATVRALSEDAPHTSVIAAPFNWDPGPHVDSAHIAGAYASPTVRIATAAVVSVQPSTIYPGPIRQSTNAPGLSTAVLNGIRHLRDNGRTYTELLTDHHDQDILLAQQLAMSGSSTWQYQPGRGAALIHIQAANYRVELNKVTINGPTFVAQSSDTGRFPLTVTNDLDVAVTVDIVLSPAEDGLTFSEIDPIALDPGQSRDVRVSSTASGSGLTQVRARLSTTTDRRFGEPWTFDLRATHIGVAIWIAMALGIGAILLMAARRIWIRAHSQGFKTRGESGA